MRRRRKAKDVGTISTRLIDDAADEGSELSSPAPEVRRRVSSDSHSSTPQESRRPKLHKSGSASWRRPKLFVTLVSARHLRNADGILSLSDPYASCEIPGKPESRIQTEPIDNTLDPVWDHRELVPGYEIGDPLIVEVFDHDDWGSDDLLGRVKVTKDKCVNQFSGELQLTDTGKVARKFWIFGQRILESYITIKIETEEVVSSEEEF